MRGKISNKKSTSFNSSSNHKEFFIYWECFSAPGRYCRTMESFTDIKKEKREDTAEKY